MPYCTTETVVKHDEAVLEAVALRCRRWTCPTCQPERRKELITLAKAGRPTTLLTLTVSHATAETRNGRADALFAFLGRLIRALRTIHPGKEIEYLAIAEETKRGEPHLHVLMRAPYIAQRWISDRARREIKAPIIDIRYVDNIGRVAAYVAKYVGKAPAQFGSHKRYFRSQGWTEKVTPAEEASRKTTHGWHHSPLSIKTLVERALTAGCAVIEETAWYCRIEHGGGMPITNWFRGGPTQRGSP